MLQKDARVSEVLITHDQIEKRAVEAAQWIKENYKDREPIMLGILKGCFPWMQEVFKNVEIDCSMEFMTVSSYMGGSKNSGTTKIIMDINTDVTNRDIIILEDIVDSGKTIKKVIEYLNLKNPRSIKIVTFLDKKAGREVELKADWVGFDVPHKFLVGFGLDFDEKFRNLPFVGVLNESEYK